MSEELLQKFLARPPPRNRRGAKLLMPRGWRNASHLLRVVAVCAAAGVTFRLEAGWPQDSAAWWSWARTMAQMMATLALPLFVLLELWERRYLGLLRYGACVTGKMVKERVKKDDGRTRVWADVEFRSSDGLFWSFSLPNRAGELVVEDEVTILCREKEHRLCGVLGTRIPLRFVAIRKI